MECDPERGDWVGADLLNSTVDPSGQPVLVLEWLVIQKDKGLWVADEKLDFRGSLGTG